jgi:imidazolonepropionase
MVVSSAVDHIGLLVTNTQALGDGRLGLVRDAAVVMEGGVVVAIEPAGTVEADEVIDAGGRCVIPGFVDSHTHLVFAGDRSEEFTARMAGKSYDGGGIRVTTEATRRTGADRLRELLAARVAEAHRAGITTLEIKSGYGLDVETEIRLLEVAGDYTEEVTFLGAHLTPAEFEGKTDEYLDLVCGPMLEAAAPLARWIDVFCERGAFDEVQSRRVLEAGRAKGLGLRVHGNQLGQGPGVRLAIEMGAASVDHCTYLAADDIEALAGSDTVATCLPITDFSTRQSYPPGRALIDAGVTVALATNCNPGSSYSTSMSLAIALAVREMHLTIEEAVWSATAGGAAALRRTDIGRLAPGSRANAVILDAPSYTHLAYRPGVPLVWKTIRGGRTTDER